MISDWLGADEDDAAVSPVIGVVMMVAVTVILAGIVTGAFLGFKPIPQDTVDAAAQTQYDPNDDQVWVTYVDKASSDYINVTMAHPGGEAKAALTRVGAKVTAEAGEENVTVNPSNGGVIIYNFSEPTGLAPNNDATLEIIVTAVRGDQKTVIYTDQGTI